MTIFNLPDLGEGLQEAEVVTWHVTTGDHVTADQPLVSVETDKAVVEVPSPQSGIIGKLFSDVGEMVAVGAALVEFKDQGREDAGAIVGEVNSQEAQETERERPDRALGNASNRGNVRATPLVRAMARKANLDLSLVAPTGPKQTITREDVERALTALAQSGPAERLKGPRLAMAQKMARAHDEVIRASVTEDADVSHWPEDTNPTLRLIEAMVSACKTEPTLNAWYDGAKMERRLNKEIHIGLAMDTKDGLFVPVIKDCQDRDSEDLASELSIIKAKVKDRSISPEEMRGATITLSNFGPMGGLYSEMVVIPPQVAILGAGRVEERIVAREGNAVVRTILPLSITFDHRPLTGGEVVRFLLAVKESLQN